MNMCDWERVCVKTHASPILTLAVNKTKNGLVGILSFNKGNCMDLFSKKQNFNPHYGTAHQQSASMGLPVHIIPKYGLGTLREKGSLSDDCALTLP